MIIDVIEGRINLQETTPELNLVDLAQELSSLKDKEPEPLAKALSSVLRHGQITSHDGASGLGSLITTRFLTPQAAPAQAALLALGALSSLTTNAIPSIAPADLIRVAAHTNPNDSWTSPGALAAASSILDAYLDTTPKLHEFIKTTVLESYLRPLFSRSRSERITATGRKAHYQPADPGRGADLTEDKTAPWKTGDAHAVTVFGWAVNHSDEQLIQDAWPLYVPVLLALLDDSDTKYRVRGLRIAHTFLAVCPGSKLRDTGLGGIIADSILPTFNFLPSLTPEDESVMLLDAAFPALLQLSRAQFSRPDDVKEKRALLAKLLRDGVFTGYWHANEYARVIEVLANHSAAAVDELALAATPYLKDLVPMYTEIISDPFMVRFPATFIAAARGLKTTMRNCWPRISTPLHQGKILQGLTLAWLSVHDDEEQTAAHEKLQAELVEAARMLAAICTAAGVDLASQTVQLCAKEEALTGLFGTAPVDA